MVEAYQIAVSFVADATRVNRMIDELIAGLGRVTQAQREAQMGFVQMTSALGGSRRLASGIAGDLRAAAGYARDIANASSKFRGFSGASGGSGNGGGSTFSSASSTRGSSATQAPVPSVLRLAPPASNPLLLTYDPGSFGVTSTAGIPGNRILGGPGVPVGAPYGPLPPSRPMPPVLMLPPPLRQAGTALAVIHGQGNSYANGPNFTATGAPYGPFTPPGWRPGPSTPNFVYGDAATVNGPQFGPPVPPSVARANQARAVAQRLQAGAGAIAPYIPRLGPMAAFAGIYGGAHGIHAMFRQGEEAGDTLALMGHAYGPDGRLFSDAQLSQASDAALSAVRTVPGASYTGMLEMIARASGITANAGEAIALAPDMARAGQIFALRGAGPNAVQQVEAAIQAGEISGLNGPDGHLDIGKVRTFLNRLTQTSFAMQGTFDLPKYLTGMRQFGVGASGADMDFLTARLPAIMRTMQESRAGTALSSLDQLMLSPAPNTRNKAYAAEQQRLGLRDQNGNVTDRDGLIRDPAQWYYTTLVPALTSHGYTSRGDIIQELSRIFSRSTVQRLGASLSADAALYNQEYQRNLAQQAQGNAPLMGYLQNAPGAQFASFTEAWRAFEAVTSEALMTPVVQSVQLITKALTEATTYVREHPNDVRQFGEDVHLLATVMTDAAKAIGTVYSYLPGPLRSMVTHAAAGAVAGAGAGSVIPGVGTVAGGAGGAILGAGYGLGSGLNISADDWNEYLFHKMHPELPASMTIQVYLDGQKISTQTQQITDKRSRQNGLAGGSNPDQHANPPLPGH